MASIHKHPRSDNYFCSFKDETGVWRSRSTGTSDARAAKRICDSWEEASELAATGDIRRERILDFYNDLLRRTGLQEIEDPAVAHWLEQWLTGRRNVSPATHRTYQQAVRELRSMWR